MTTTHGDQNHLCLFLYLCIAIFTLTFRRGSQPGRMKCTSPSIPIKGATVLFSELERGYVNRSLNHEWPSRSICVNKCHGNRTRDYGISVTRPLLPISLIVECVLPFLERETYDNCRILNKDIFFTSQMAGTPPWPTTCIRMKGIVSSLAFANSGTQIACGLEDGTICIISTTGRSTTLGSCFSASEFLVYSPDDTVLISSNRDCNIYIWYLNRPNNDHKAILSGHCTPVHSISFFPGGDVFAACGYEDHVVLWRISTESCIARIPHKAKLERN